MASFLPRLGIVDDSYKPAIIMRNNRDHLAVHRFRTLRTCEETSSDLPQFACVLFLVTTRRTHGESLELIAWMTPRIHRGLA